VHDPHHAIHEETSQQVLGLHEDDRVTETQPVSACVHEAGEVEEGDEPATEVGEAGNTGRRSWDRSDRSKGENFAD